VACFTPLYVVIAIISGVASVIQVIMQFAWLATPPDMSLSAADLWRLFGFVPCEP
jgi:hypothetical protein